MKLYTILMSLIISLSILLVVHTEDVFTTFGIYGILSILAIPVSNQYEFKKENE